MLAYDDAFRRNVFSTLLSNTRIMFEAHQPLHTFKVDVLQIYKPRNCAQRWAFLNTNPTNQNNCDHTTNTSPSMSLSFSEPHSEYMIWIPRRYSVKYPCLHVSLSVYLQYTLLIHIAASKKRRKAFHQLPHATINSNILLIRFGPLRLGVPYRSFPISG